MIGSTIASSTPTIFCGRKRRPSTSEDDVMDDCMAAMVLMSLSCSPKSQRLPELIIYKCTWPGCLYQSEHCQQIEKHVRTQHLGRTDLKDGESSDHEEEFYYTEIEMDDNSMHSSSSNSSLSHSLPQSPSVSTDTSATNGSQSPQPSPQTHIFFGQSCSAPTFSHLQDHEYERRRQNSHFDYKLIQFNNDVNDLNGFSINLKKNGFTKLNNANNNNNNLNNNGNHGTRSKHKSLLSTPINIPGVSPLSAYRSHQYATSAPPVPIHSPRVNHKYMRLHSNNNRVSGSGTDLTIGTTILQSSPNKNSPSKRGRGESRKCRKVYGMDNRDSWCTQCKWKKACTRFTD
ncbi:zinc finger protein 704-like [Oppia nitens]|uniref:zinc finger protein 704-like n=1 Tax=Oppia nitens TaxID=1686743 RepID=UPI0023DC9CDD|nr:zinc finger protein 704-like [Oppia nitens]